MQITSVCLFVCFDHFLMQYCVKYFVILVRAGYFTFLSAFRVTLCFKFIKLSLFLCIMNWWILLLNFIFLIWSPPLSCEQCQTPLTRRKLITETSVGKDLETRLCRFFGQRFYILAPQRLASILNRRYYIPQRIFKKGFCKFWFCYNTHWLILIGNAFTNG